MLEIDNRPRSPTEHTARQGAEIGRSPSPSQKHQIVDYVPSVTIRHDRKIKKLNDVLDADIALKKQRVEQKKLKEKEKKAKAALRLKKQQQRIKTQKLKGVSQRSKRIAPTKQKKPAKVARKIKNAMKQQQGLGAECTPLPTVTITQGAAEKIQMASTKKQVKSVRRTPEKKAVKGRR